MCKVLKIHLESTGETQQQLADKIGIRQETVSKAVTGQVTQSLLESFADATGIPPRKLRPDLARLFQ